MNPRYSERQREREDSALPCPHCGGAPFFTDMAFQVSCNNTACINFAQRYPHSLWNALAREATDGRTDGV